MNLRSASRKTLRMGEAKDSHRSAPRDSPGQRQYHGRTSRRRQDAGPLCIVTWRRPPLAAAVSLYA